MKGRDGAAMLRPAEHPNDPGGVRPTMLLTPLVLVVVWLMLQKGCVPKDDVLPSAALTAKVGAEAAFSVSGKNWKQ